MPSLVLCYAPEDDALARRLGEYLAANLACNIVYGECVVRPGFDLVDAAERAISAELALVLLSPHSVPKPWQREKWTPVFLEQPEQFDCLLGCVLLEECRFPDLLRRQRFFDATSDFQGAVRRIRRWILHPDQLLRPDAATDVIPDARVLGLRKRVGDQPGTETGVDYALVAAFSADCQLDFEGACTVDCLGRTRAGVLGDIGHAVHLRLAGNVPENHGACVDWCRVHRYLFVLHNVAPEDHVFLAFGGLSSVIFTAASPGRMPADEGQIEAVFIASPRHEAACLALLSDAAACVAGLLDSAYDSGLRLGWAVVSVLRAAERFAETVEVLEMMEMAARRCGDTPGLFRIEWEQSWLRDTSAHDGTVNILPTAGPEVAQLVLPFASLQQ